MARLTVYYQLLVHVICFHQILATTNDTTVITSIDPASTSTPVIPALATTSIVAGTTNQPTTAPPKFPECNITSVNGCVNDVIQNYGNQSGGFYKKLTDSCEIRNKSSFSILPRNNCSMINTAFNSTSEFGLICSSNSLGFQAVEYHVGTRDSNVWTYINTSTAAFCGIVSLNCTLHQLEDGFYYVTVERNIFLKKLLTVCATTTKKPTTTQIPLLPNPVGPAAITAIVVLVCLTIISILAGFFFWPKCHNPQAPALPKKTMQPTESTAKIVPGGARKKTAVPVVTVTGLSQV